MKPNDDILTLKEVAELLRFSIHTVYQNWKKWGLKPYVITPNAKPRFFKSQVLKLLEQPK